MPQVWLSGLFEAQVHLNKGFMVVRSTAKALVMDGWRSGAEVPRGSEAWAGILTPSCHPPSLLALQVGCERGILADHTGRRTGKAGCLAHLEVERVEVRHRVQNDWKHEGKAKCRKARLVPHGN